MRCSSLIDWPVYPRRAEHNTVAKGGNRIWVELRAAGTALSVTPAPRHALGSGRAISAVLGEGRARAAKRVDEAMRPLGWTTCRMGRAGLRVASR